MSNKQNPKFVKLPNGNIVRVSSSGFITVKVDVELSDLIDHDSEGVLDLLSEKATGTELLCDINYKVVGHNSNTIEVEVTGELSMIDVEDVDVEQLPVVEFEVEVVRIGCGSRTIRLSARTMEEAEDIADDDAGNHLYPEHHSEYVIRAIPA